MTTHRRFALVPILLGLLVVPACKSKAPATKGQPATSKPASTAAVSSADDEDDNDGDDPADKSAPVKGASAKGDAAENAANRARMLSKDLSDPAEAAKKTTALVVKKPASGGCGEVTVGAKKFVFDCEDSGEVKGASESIASESDLGDGAAAPVKLPDFVDFRAKKLVGPVIDQGQTLSCSAVSLASVLNHEIATHTGKPGDVSPMLIWGRYHTAKMDAAIQSNEGKGIVPMSVLKYDWKAANAWLEQKPPTNDFLAKFEPQAIVKISDVVKIDVADIKGTLAQGHAVWFSIAGGHSLLKTVGAKGGPQMIPAYDARALPASQQMGHAIAMVGYRPMKNGKTAYLIQNSWGADYGEDGFAYIDEDTLAKNYKYGYTVEIEPVGAKPKKAVGSEGAAAPTKCKPGALPDAETGKCAARCPDGSARNDGACAEAGECEKGEVSVKGKCVRAAPTIKKKKNGFAMACVPGGCAYGFAKGVSGCARDKGCVVSCPAPTFKLVKKGSTLRCN